MKWLLVLSVLIGDYLNVQKRWQGFLFWIVTDGALGYMSFQEGKYEESTVFLLYLVFAILGIYKWKFKKYVS